MPLLQWSSSHSILSECRWLGEPELIPEFLIIRPAGRIRSAHSVSEHARPDEPSPGGAQRWAIGGEPGLLIISNSSLASLQTKCHLVPTGGVWAGSQTRWQSKQRRAKALHQKRRVDGDILSSLRGGEHYSIKGYFIHLVLSSFMFRQWIKLTPDIRTCIKVS